MSTLYLDTHAAVFLVSGLVEKFSKHRLRRLEKSKLLISPMVMLEFQYLFELGKVKSTPSEILISLSSEHDFEISKLPFAEVALHAMNEAWTRDVFDRMITAQARLEQIPLLTRDRQIQKNYSQAIWD